MTRFRVAVVPPPVSPLPHLSLSFRCFRWNRSVDEKELFSLWTLPKDLTLRLGLE